MGKSTTDRTMKAGSKRTDGTIREQDEREITTVENGKVTVENKPEK